MCNACLNAKLYTVITIIICRCNHVQWSNHIKGTSLTYTSVLVAKATMGPHLEAGYSILAEMFLHVRLRVSYQPICSLTIPVIRLLWKPGTLSEFCTQCSCLAWFYTLCSCLAWLSRNVLLIFLLYISSIVEMESKLVFLVLLFLLAESTTGLCVQSECCVIYVDIRLMF